MIAFFCKLALVASYFFAVVSFAEDFLPEEIPSQIALSLFKAKGVRQTYYLLTRDRSGTSGNHYLLVHENGKLRFPRQTAGVVYFDGGSIDLKFENGERLTVPTERLSEGALGVPQTPMMMSVDRAPFHLQKIEINLAILKRLGFSKFIAPKTETKPELEQSAPTKKNEYVFFAYPETVQIVEFNPSTQTRGDDREDQINKLINEIDPTRIKTSDRVNQGAFYGYGHTVLIVITDPGSSLPKLRAQLDQYGEVRVVSDSVLSEISRNFRSIASDFNAASEEKKIDCIRLIFKNMGQLERYFLMVDAMAEYETAIASRENGVMDASVGTAYNTKARRKHPFYLAVLAKIRSAARAGYEVLDQIGHPAAQEILTHTAQEFDYAAVDIVRGKASVGQQYYFDLWLKFMLSDLNFADALPEDGTERPEGVRTSQASGGVFQNFKISGELVGVNSRGIVSHYLEKRPKFLLNLLGLPGNKDRLKTSVIQFIIDADKKAVKIVAWAERMKLAQAYRYSVQDSFNAKGIINITDLLISLAWTPYWLSGIEGFSVSEYQTSVMEIFTTLFDIAPISLKTTGTMAALIDASIYILNDVQNTKAIIQRNPSPRVEQTARILENRLRAYLQNSVQNLAFVQTEGAVSACEILLSPDTFEKAKKANGW